MAPKSPVDVVATAFSPTKHGFKFVNNFSIDKSEFKLGEGKLHFGLCGGMSLYALRKFNKGEAMPKLRKPVLSEYRAAANLESPHVRH